ncbi:MAG TPA: hypothetical protein VN281_07940 [Verrucomicrobiae bacterium]|jgi:hypothetical protein|nr:hypothetical protein [Verrucomicrobiae bacterium]
MKNPDYPVQQAELISTQGDRMTRAELLSIAFTIVHPAEWQDRPADRLWQLFDKRSRSLLKTAAERMLSEMHPEEQLLRIIGTAVWDERTPPKPGHGGIPRAFLEEIAHWQPE